MSNYVLCYAKTPRSDDFTLVRNLSSGKYNLPGGLIKQDERVTQAACRELLEAVGIHCAEKDVSVLGTLENGWGDKFFICRCEYKVERNVEPLFPEDIVRVHIGNAIKELELMPDLRYIIPLCEYSINGWHLWEISTGRYELTTQNIIKAL